MPENNMNICDLALAVYLKIADDLPRNLHLGSLKMFFLLSIQYLGYRLLYET